MNKVLFIICAIIVYHAYSIWDDGLTKCTTVDFVTYIDNNCNAVSGSIGENEIKQLAEAGFKTIVRLNGNGLDQGVISKGDEAVLCYKYGLQYLYFDIEDRVEEVAAILAEKHFVFGGVLVHCRNGRHRGPTMVAWYMKNVLNYADSTIIDMLNWEEILMDPRFDKYTEKIFQ